MPCGEAASESSRSSNGSSLSSESARKPCAEFGFTQFPQEGSSVQPDPTKPGQKPRLENILSDARLKGSFPIRITMSINRKQSVYEFADPDTWRILDDDTEALFMNGRTFVDIPGEGWVTSGDRMDNSLSLLDIMGIFSLLLDDPASLHLESTGRGPCIVANEKQCDTFLRPADSFKVWSHTDSHLLDHWEAGSDVLDVAYNVTISAIAQPASYRDLDEEMRQMMRMNGMQ